MSDLLGQDPSDYPQPDTDIGRTELEAAQGVPMWIVAAGPGVGSIGTQAELNRTPGRTLLAEGTVYDPAQFPDLARFLAPFYGQHRVPPLSSPAWL